MHDSYDKTIAGAFVAAIKSRTSLPIHDFSDRSPASDNIKLLEYREKRDLENKYNAKYEQSYDDNLFN
jgi:hypothetical protein